MSNIHIDPLHILKTTFGFDKFRDGQEQLVKNILAGRDTIGVMPTGAGKSICYQVPALAIGGISIIISPLISLMKDQVAALNEVGVYAAYINSSLSARQISLALQYAKQGKYKIIYVAPERLESEEFLDFACNADIKMVTVDEAHCISQWGQDFRPSYLKIAGFIKQLPNRPIISAFTATAATNEVIATLMGRKLAKLSTNKMINSRFYGKRSNEREAYLKHVINKLIIDEYLYLTNDKYSIVKLNRLANTILNDNTRIIMKVTKISKEQSSTDKSKMIRKSEILNSKGLELLDILRQLRIERAREEGMPPYIIFSDKTLIDMCIKLPFNKSDMLTVNGVGEHKYEKYGQMFIDAIRKFTGDTKQTLYYEGTIENPLQKNIGLSKRVKKAEFYLTDDIKQGIRPLGKVSISQFVNHLNGLRDEKVMKRLAASYLTSILKEEGYLSEQYNHLLGRNTVTVTEEGQKLGISTETRISERGNEYSIVIYDDNAQEYLVSLIPKDRNQYEGV